MKTQILRRFNNYFTANIILTRLQGMGVDCFLKDEYTVTIDPLLSNAIGGIKLEVHEDDAALAEKLLVQFDEEYLRSAVCPGCLGNDIQFIHMAGAQNFVSRFLTYLFPSYKVEDKQVYKCGNCGYESKSLPENTSVYN